MQNGKNVEERDTSAEGRDIGYKGGEGKWFWPQIQKYNNAKILNTKMQKRRRQKMGSAKTQQKQPCKNTKYKNTKEGEEM